MKTIFTSKQNARVRPHDLQVRTQNAATYGLKHKSLKILGSKYGTHCLLKQNSKFKEYINLWSGPSCKCNLCKSI